MDKKKSDKPNEEVRVGDFLQSVQWLNFQKMTGRRIFQFKAENFIAGAVEHKLEFFGSYFYIPRGPIFLVGVQVDEIKKGLHELVDLAKKNKAIWIRFDATDENFLRKIKEGIGWRIQKAPHDMQPNEVFKINIQKSEGDLLSGMKAKTRYNINLAIKKGVTVKVADRSEQFAAEEFLRLIQVTSERDGIISHPTDYYHQMLRSIPEENLKLYIAEYAGKIIAANLEVFYGDTATYLHGASDNVSRNVMAPYLLQWQAIKDAKTKGFLFYDFGGVKTDQAVSNSWRGITRFKIGFAPATPATFFKGSYDIVLDERKYRLYLWLQKIKKIIR